MTGATRPGPTYCWGQDGSSAKPGMSSRASSLVGTCASSWHEMATTDAMTRMGIARLAGRSIARAVLIASAEMSMLAAAIFCNHLRAVSYTHLTLPTIYSV